MTENRTEITSIPDWYLETFQVVQHLDGGLRNVELELREALEIDSLDARVRAEMQGVLDALHGIKGNLVLVDMTAREVLDQLLS
jgi:hypothetical protein